jgi:tetratricopeptide (TPR) repeat protein
VLALLLLPAATQDAPSEALLQEARRLERVAESREMQLRALPDRLAAIDEAVAKFRVARASPGADAALVERAVLTEEDLLWRAAEGLMLAGRFDEARARYEDSIETCGSSRTERHSRVARTRAAVAHLELERRRLAEAERQVAEAEAELAEGAEEPGVARRAHAVWAARARVDFKSGLHDAAVLRMGEAVRAAREQEMVGYASHHAERLAEFLLYLGRAERAVAVLEEALAQTDRPNRRAQVAAWLARALEGAGRPEEALGILDAEVEPFLPTSRAHAQLAVRALHFRVRALRALGRLEEARRALEEGRERFEAADEEARSFALELRATLECEAGRLEEAVEAGEANLERVGAMGWSPSSAVLRALGLAKARLGRREEGLAHLRKAFASSVGWISRLQGTEDAASTLGVVVRAAEDLLDVLAGPKGSTDPGIVGEAFRAIEVSKAEGLRRALVRRTSEVPELDPDLEGRRRDLFRRLSLLSARMEAGRGGEARARLERDDLEREAEDLEREFRRRHPRAGEIRGLEPVTLEEFGDALAPDTVVLDYIVGDREAFALVVWRGGARLARLGPAGRLRNACGSAFALLRSGEADRRTLLESTRGFSDGLLAAPLAGVEGRIRRLLVLPDGSLHRLPFEALPSPFGPGFLVEDVEVAYAPSVSAHLALLRGALDPEGIAFLGVAVSEGLEPGPADAARPALRSGLGPLPRAEQEVRSAAALAGSERVLLLGKAATPEAVRALDLRRFRLLHFATHGVGDEEAPGRSGLLLHDSGDPSGRAVLEARAIAGLRLGADLAVLSACRSGGGPIQPGEGVRSLARSFLEAGSRSVLLTLWEISDPVCLAFMDLFYGALRDGASKGEALRRAKVESLGAGGARSGLRAPSAWAGFVLLGDAEGRIPLAGTRPGRGAPSGWLVLASLVAGGGTFLLARRRPAAA